MPKPVSTSALLMALARVGIPALLEAEMGGVFDGVLA